jgi:hypothetical protein
MRSGPVSHDLSAPGGIGRSRALLWVFTGFVALMAGAAATRLSVPYLAGFLAGGLLVFVFIWRQQEPMVPFLLLVAAIQGGVLLKVPLGDAPITTLMPVLGGWTLLAVLLDGSKRRRVRPVSRAGRLLVPSLVTFFAIVAITALVQVWRPDGRLLSLTAALTLVQFAVLVVLTAFLLSSPRRVLWVAYVTVGAGAAVALTALANRLGLVTLGTEVVYVEGYTRISGLLNDPNFFSFQLLISLAFAVHLVLAAKTLALRIVFGVALVTLFAGIVSTYSAGALLGVAVVLVTTVVLQLRMSTKRALIAFCLVAIASAVTAATAPPGYGEAIKEKYAGITSSSFEQLGTKRGAAWEAGARQVASDPVFGVGLSTQNLQAAIADHYTLYMAERKAAHNTFISVAVGSGVGGLVSFLMVLGSCFAVLWAAYSRAAKEADSDAVLATGCVFTALVVAFAQGLQLDLQFQKYLWLLVGASLAIRYWPSKQATGEAEDREDGD